MFMFNKAAVTVPFLIGDLNSIKSLKNEECFKFVKMFHLSSKCFFSLAMN